MLQSHLPPRPHTLPSLKKKKHPQASNFIALAEEEGTEEGEERGEWEGKKEGRTKEGRGEGQGGRERGGRDRRTSLCFASDVAFWNCASQERHSILGHPTHLGTWDPFSTRF